SMQSLNGDSVGVQDDEAWRAAGDNSDIENLLTLGPKLNLAEDEAHGLHRQPARLSASNCDDQNSWSRLVFLHLRYPHIRLDILRKRYTQEITRLLCIRLLYTDTSQLAPQRILDRIHFALLQR